MWSIFNRSPPKERPRRYVIRDIGVGIFPITEKYKNEGVSGGWLEYDGHFDDEWHNLVIMYRHTPRSY